MTKKPMYADHVKELESGVGPFGFASEGGILVSTAEAMKRYSDEWQDPEGNAKLQGRTPSHLDRDRILYSDAFRRQDDKYHVIFVGKSRLSRNYTVHAVKAAHVARSIANRLALNSTLTEAMVLGSKVGGTPFLHRSKRVVEEWVKTKVNDVDSSAPDRPRTSSQPAMEIDPNNNELVLPGWIESIQSPNIKADVRRFIPWAAGSQSAPAYHSGQGSYWSLTVNPYLLTSADPGYTAQTMYGIWRHSLDYQGPPTGIFDHRLDLGKVRHNISAAHATHEARLGRFCDDITWVLENLHESARVAQLDGTETCYSTLGRMHRNNFDNSTQAALASADTGKLYTYFIDDVVKTSKANFASASPGQIASELEPLVSMSAQASRTLSLMKEFLNSSIFSHERIEFRNKTLDAIVLTALDLLYSSYAKVMPDYLRQNGRLAGWYDEQSFAQAREALESPIHRIQVAVDVLISMSDRDVYELVGLE